LDFEDRPALRAARAELEIWDGSLTTTLRRMPGRETLALDE
jgi:hypothetical protein